MEGDPPIRINWKNQAAVAIIGSAITLEIAHAGNCDWPLIASARWTIIGLALLLAATFICIYIFDDFRSQAWDFIVTLLAFVGIAITWMALFYPAPGYGVLLTADIVVLWLAWIVRRIAIPSA